MSKSPMNEGEAVAIAELSVDEQTVVEHAAGDDSLVFGIVPALGTC